MATTATATVNTKNEEAAAKLRSEINVLSKDVAELQSKLGAAQQTLATLEGQRLKLAADSLDGKRVDATLSAEIHSKIDAARLPIEVLQPRLTEKQRTLDQTRVPRISGAIRNLLELLAEYDAIRDELRVAFSDSDKTDAARQLLASYGQALWDRSSPRAETELLQQGWVVRGDLQFICRNLRPPKP